MEINDYKHGKCQHSNCNHCFIIYQTYPIKISVNKINNKKPDEYFINCFIQNTYIL
jgi:hypothetical protein